MSDTNSILLGFGLSLGAGMSTCLGSLAPYMTDLKNTRFLAGSLSISAGVMLYVSFVEIIFKSREFMEEEMSQSGAAWLSTFCFFMGFALCWGLNEIAHRLERWDANRRLLKEKKCIVHQTSVGHDSESVYTDQELQVLSHEGHHSSAKSEGDIEAADAHTTKPEPTLADADIELDNHKAQELKTMGLMTALAIAIHNFPEGIATYVAAQADPSLGVAMAIAIALHNIPEGVCVSIPIYYASRDIRQALKWSFLSGISEPLGALLGWLVLDNVFTSVTYGVLFGIVGGMMVYLCLGELIPTALSFSNNRKFVTLNVAIGMVLMSVSLLLLEL